MKFLTLSEIDTLSKEDIKQIIDSRSEILVKMAGERLIGNKLEANEMKKKQCDYNTRHSFTITKVERSKDDDTQYISSIANTIKVYTDSTLKMQKFYNNELLQSTLSSLMTEMFGERSHARWSYQKLQGEDFFTVEFFMPHHLVIPDFVAFDEYKEKSKKLTQTSKNKLKEKIDNELLLKIDELKNISFNLYKEDSWYAPEDKKELTAFIKKHTSTFDRQALRGVVQKYPNDEKIVLLCLERCNDEVFEYAGKELKSNRAFIEKAVLKHKFINILEFVDDEFKDDEELMLKAIKIGGGYIARAASPRLKNKKDFCLTAVKNQVEAIGVISEQMKKDKDIMMEVISQRGDYLMMYDEVKTDKNLLIKAFSTAFDRQSFNLLEHTSEEFKNDKQVALAAVQCYKDNYHYLGNELKKEIGDNDPLYYLTRVELNKKLNSEIEEKKTSKKRMKM